MLRSLCRSNSLPPFIVDHRDSSHFPNGFCARDVKVIGGVIAVLAEHSLSNDSSSLTYQRTRRFVDAIRFPDATAVKSI